MFSNSGSILKLRIHREMLTRFGVEITRGQTAAGQRKTEGNTHNFSKRFIDYLDETTSEIKKILFFVFKYDYIDYRGRLTASVVKARGYRPRGPGSIPGTTRFSEK
jgi:hypothetical protein